MTFQERRIANEWEFIERLATRNSELLSQPTRKLGPNGAVFEFTLFGTEALTGSAPTLTLRSEHAVSLQFGPFFPAVPVETFVLDPVFHPNAHPMNGFVCLWDRYSAGDSSLDAIFKLQRVLAWELYSTHADQVLNPDALEWLNRMDLPLRYSRLQVPPELESECGYRGLRPPKIRRVRLSSIQGN